MLRAFMLSDQGREVTLYRLGPGEICLFSASCMLHGISADLSLEAERDCGFWVIPPGVYRQLMEQSLPVAGYTNQIMGRRFSQVTWLVEQVLFRGMDQRLAAFLLEESRLEGSTRLSMTHERAAAHLGTAREVVTRMLRYLQQEGLVSLSRGRVELTDPKGLERLAGDALPPAGP